MSRQYSSYTPSSRYSRSDRHESDADGHRSGLGPDGNTGAADYRAGYDSDYDTEYDTGYDTKYDADYPEDYTYTEQLDRRWVWVAGVAGAILLVAVICTVVILGGGDSGQVSATVSPPTSAVPTTAAGAAPPVAAPAPLPAPATSLAPETVTTVTPTPTATAQAPAAPVAPPEAAPAQPPAPAPDPRTITYQVTGNRQLLDLVTVIYTDNQGALQTDINVPLPWTKTIVLDPGVTLTSVTATSLTGQLNCTITNAAGATIAQRLDNTIITTCTN